MRIEFHRDAERQTHDDVINAFNNSVGIMERRLVQEITSNKWQWPTPPTPRDVVDKGQLRDSLFIYQGLSREGNPVAYYIWTAEYAQPVHEGATFRDGRVYPARPWTKIPREQFPELMIMLIRQGGQGRLAQLAVRL